MLNKDAGDQVELLVPRDVFARMVPDLDTKKVQELGVALNGDGKGATLVGSRVALEVLGFGALLAEMTRIAEENRDRAID